MGRNYAALMLRVLRFLLLLAITAMALNLVIGAGTPQTGPIEKVVLCVLIVGLFVVAVPVRRIGRRPSPA
jgi:hypothetical protein